ncbi:MAG: hypothetical protein RL398_3451 [Planctomycetota bacterium]
MRILTTLAASLLTAAAFAQSPLTTTFVSDNSGAAGGTIFFDLTVNAPLTLTTLDVNFISAASTAGSIDIYTCPTTYVGNTGNSAAWTLLGSGAATAAGANLPTPVAIPPILMTPGTYGIAFVATGLGFAYTNGNGTNQIYSTNELTLSAGAAGNAPWPAAPFTPRVVNCSIGYGLGSGGTVATRTNYGTGCVDKAASFYEHFLTTPSIDLSNTAFRMVYTGAGYLVLPSLSAFVAPSGTATNLNLGDDTTTSVTLSGAFPYPGGSTSTLEVCSNGFVSAAAGNGTSYTPAPAAMLGRPHASWNVWRDFICNATGNVWFEEVGGIAYITWNGVVGYQGQVAGTVPSTFQLQFDIAQGHVDFVFLSMDTVSVSGWAGGEGWVVGYSPAGASRDPGGIDLSAVVPGTLVLEGQDLNPLALSASARPIGGTTITLDTANIPAGAPFGAILIGFVQFNPGLDLTALGMPGCARYTDGSTSLLYLPFGGTSNSLNFPVPNFVGVQLYAQSIAFAPAAGLTPLGAIASNGVALGIGNL